jgi:peptidyl-prolyl cis-trans isomerase SurA
MLTHSTRKGIFRPALPADSARKTKMISTIARQNPFVVAASRLRGWPLVAGALAAAVIASAAPQPALAQVALVVNGDPITVYDIEQRGKFMQLTTRKPPTRNQIVEDLISDKLKIQIGKRYKLEVTDDEVDSMMGEMAKRVRQTPAQLTQQLANAGIDASTLKERLRADYVWQQIVRGKFQSSLQVTDKEIAVALRGKNKDAKDLTGIEYTLRPILFVVPRGAGEGAVDARKREAEALRARFDTCETGIPFARALRDVAVRDPVIKTSADLAPALREILDKTTVGKLTEPEVTQTGVEVFALCARRETKLESAAKREVQNELFAEQFQSNSSKFLRSLRRSAMIEVKDTGDAKAAGVNSR